MRHLSFALPLLLLACASAPESLELEVLRAAREYGGYGRVDDELRWAPFLCRSPEPSVGRLSRAASDSPHGRKLYYVFARDRAAYVKRQGQPTGQVIVKEAWLPQEAPGLTAEQAGERVVDDRAQFLGGFVPYAFRDGKVYEAAERAGLFIMLKTSPERPDTDEGWVYATTSPDGLRLTSLGRLDSCMGCHRDAPSDRLFGLPIR